MPRPPSLAEQAMEIQADIAEIERDAAPMWVLATRSKSERIKGHVLLLARLLRITRAEAHELAGAAEGEAA